MRGGFTLFETIISIALFIVLIGSFGGFVVSIQNSRISLQSEQEVDENIRLATSIISQKIRNATSVNSGSSTFGTDPGVVSLSMADASVNPTVFRLNQDNGILLMQEGSSQPVALTTDEVAITQLVFSLISSASEPENIRMTIEAQAQSTDNSYASFTHTIRTSTSIRQ